MAEIKFNLLEVDLDRNESQVIDVTEDVKRYLGARGLANKLIWDMVPQGTDALSPENILHVGVGPLTGLMGTKTVFSFISPLTGWAGRATSSGYFGEEIVNAQYNAGILIKGQALKPVYLYIWDDEVEIRDASDLWGEWKQKTEFTIRDRLNEETGEIFGVASIGPAGENLVRFANVTTEFVHSASKWGVGAVMGSKNLKAIAVRGTKGPLYADHDTVWQLFKTYATHPETMLRKLGESRYGHTTSMPVLYHAGAEPIKNNHLGWHEVCEESNALAQDLRYHVWSDGCPGCAAACFVPYLKHSDKGTFVGEFRHDNTGNFNANIMVGYDQMTDISPYIDELGFDGEECGSLVAWAMDLYENDIITQDDLGGINLKWGDIEAVRELLTKIAYKEDRAPAALAEGFRRAYEVFGEESKWYAWEVNGCGCGTYDHRALDAPRVRPWAYAASHNGARMGFSLSDGLAEAGTICNFAAPPFGAIWGSNEEAAAVFLNAICGWDVSVDDVKEITLRNYYFNRCVSLREGYDPAEDGQLPPRAFEETITTKYGKDLILDREEHLERLKQYYVEDLHLSEDGLPTQENIEKLGLDFVIPVLEPMGKIA